uniref:WD_REPEATS_REGION domain-containing protein n=1 Tax=Macrostomum lignano TaxID=282301 RepID=A0A1I8FL98_9PLAT
LPGEARGKPRGHRGATRGWLRQRGGVRGAEPRLKYHRVGQGNTDLPRILDKDFITSLAVHSKFICVGTNWGNIYILDHMGNNIQGRSLSGHSTTVNQISVDEKGEYLASCSMDERVIIHNLFKQEDLFHSEAGQASVRRGHLAELRRHAVIRHWRRRLILVEPGFIKKQHRVLAEARPNCGAIRLH